MKWLPFLPLRQRNGDLGGPYGDSHNSNTSETGCWSDKEGLLEFWQVCKALTKKEGVEGWEAHGGSGGGSPSCAKVLGLNSYYGSSLQVVAPPLSLGNRE